jgi:demethylmenaquinone methyltransferase/2-methoxy-6-polyprenyl-1,4-benzoquinol methylase
MAVSLTGRKYGPPQFTNESSLLQAKYNITAMFYDILDYPWERIHEKWRPVLLADIRGQVLEAGVGTGRNLRRYHHTVKLMGLDLSDAMLRKARKRVKTSPCKTKLIHEDATIMKSVDANQFDWVFSTFMCCVMPDNLQELAIEQFGRAFKPSRADDFGFLNWCIQRIRV